MIPISVCIITKNESEALEKCLAALKRYPYEIIVADTGSTDDSKDIARKYADKVLDFTWCDDFSAARNFAISKASHNMILSLDTDEVVTDIDLDAVDRLIEENPTSVGMIELQNYFEVNGERNVQIERLGRLFNRKYYTFVNKIHEALSPVGKTVYTTYRTPIKVDHFGYLGSQEKLNEKSMRNINLLMEDLKASPDEPYYYFQIGQSYLVMRDHENAFKYLSLALEHNPSPSNDYTKMLLLNYGSLALDFQKDERLSSLLDFYGYYQDNANYLCLVGKIYLHQNQPLKALPEFIKALTAPEYDSPDCKTTVPSFYIGYIYEVFGQKDIAKQHYQKCGDYAPAVERLRELA